MTSENDHTKEQHQNLEAPIVLTPDQIQQVAGGSSETASSLNATGHGPLVNGIIELLNTRNFRNISSQLEKELPSSQQFGG